jgi:hypothetical protein
LDANTYSLKQILNQERRYLVPTFQRDYEWTREDQWELLFDDLEAVADRLYEARARAEATGEALSKIEKRVAPHFLGAVVLDQLPAPAGGIDLRAVIDGQQRLTTLQLMLRGLLDVLIEKSSPRVRQVRRLLENPSDVVSDEYERHKLWPRRRDRDPWIGAMADVAEVTDEDRYLEARRYFADRARIATVGLDGEDRTDVVIDAVIDLFKLVVIDLEDNDDAQVIFEVLNGRQTPLSAADLVKNLLFLRAEMANEQELEATYNKYWAPFDDKWWTFTVGRGHAARGRRDVLLSSWLTAVSGEEANVGHLYQEVRRYLDSADRKTIDVLTELHDYGRAYRAVYGATDPGSTRLATAYQRLDRLGISTAVPLLLWFRTISEDRFPLADHERAVVAIESWVVRRLIIGANTRGYGKAFVDVLQAAKHAELTADGNITDAVIQALRDGPHSLSWPINAEIEEAMVTRKFYDAYTQERIRLLLGALDERMQHENPKTEAATFAYDKLQIEHVMPRAWQKHWPLVPTDDTERILASQRREAAIHRLGNLTLVTSTFNQSVSNSAWHVKQPELFTHSKLQLNAGFADCANWDEAAIEQRGRQLASVATSVWPTPNALLGYEHRT